MSTFIHNVIQKLVFPCVSFIRRFLSSLRALPLAMVTGALLFHGCSCGKGNHGRVLRIGVDAEWYPIDFGSQQPFVNGFVGDLLLEISGYSGISFEKIDANPNTLLEGIWEKRYDAALTSLPPYTFNVAKYDFSHNFLDLGPVLIVPANARHTELSAMSGELVGLISGDPASLLFAAYPEVILRNYPSIPELLNAVVSGEIEGALLNRIPAVNYIRDLYVDKLKIASTPMTESGLHLVAAKGRQESLIKAFDRSLDHFKKKKRLQVLLKKWNLETP